MSQLALPLQLADHAVFASFLPAGNELPVATLESLACGDDGGHGYWLRGAGGTGKTHLLQAVCERAGDRAVYLPLAVVGEAGPAVLEGLESRDIVCIDDIDRAARDTDWEFGLFSLCNRLAESGGQLLAAAGAAPRECGFQLADLESRLSRLAVFHLHELDDGERAAALMLRAAHRGLDLSEDAATFMLRRSRRDMASLYALLDRLDLEALRAQRRLTVPFVREILAEAEAD